MADNKQFHDPLDEVIGRIANTKNKTSGGIAIPEHKSSIDDITPDSGVTIKKVDNKVPEINYGDDDIDNEIKAAEEADRQSKEEKLVELEKSKEEHPEEIMPPQPYDMEAVSNDLAFQESTLDIVSRMIRQVVKINKIPNGGVPDVIPGTNRPLKRAVMGDLIEQYHINGDVITKDFENLVLDNWYLDSGITARAFVDNGYSENPVEDTDTSSNDNTTPETKESDTEEEEKGNVVININAQEDQPVNINIDEEVLRNIKKEERVIDVFVKRVSEKEMFTSKTVENSDLEDIITPYDPGLQDIQGVVPMSGYRIIIRPMSWLEIMSLVNPSGRTYKDKFIKQWSIIYSHIKWTSIGMFKDLDDFMSKTKFIDLQYLMWLVLVATSAENETITLTCGNEKCPYSMQYTYSPRTIIKLDEELVPDYYESVETAAPGQDAIKVFQGISAHVMYELPDTKTIIEISSPSAKDFINRLSRMEKTFNKYAVDTDITFDQYLPRFLMQIQESTEGISNINVAVEMLAGLLITSATIRHNGTNYRYTNWDDIERIIKTHLSLEDSYILFNKVFGDNSALATPVSFQLEGFKCPKCGRNNTNVPVNDIAESLLFLLSQRYENTKINLIKQQPNS